VYKRQLEAIPEDVDFGYKPHPKSMALGRLAGHLTDFAGDWALHTVTKDKLEFAADHKWEAYEMCIRDRLNTCGDCLWGRERGRWGR